MKKFLTSKDVGLIVLVFIVSRIIIYFFGVELQYDALYKYWQYLDVETLHHNLLAGIWYNHAQPPLFNLLIGSVLKIFGEHSIWVFAGLFKIITLINTLLLLSILKGLTRRDKLSMLLALVYMLSPAAMVYENELFYTTFISMLFLFAAASLVGMRDGITWRNAFGLSISLLAICLTRSMYHFVWLAVISGILLLYFKRVEGVSKLLIASVFSVIILGGWYAKNYAIFGRFSTSSWIGMNLSRNVFHDNEVTDSTKIEAFRTFSPISDYRPFIKGDAEKKYAGLNDRDLLGEFKNDTLMNLNHVAYIEVSDKYMAACKQHIKAHPAAFLQNIVQSGILFFAPATRYSVTEFQARKIRYYDLIYSFNLSHFAEGKQQRRIAVTISAIPKFAIYAFVFFGLFRNWIRTRRISGLNLFILTVVVYVFGISSLLEHYENMRFRFEIEPLFILLLAQAITVFWKRTEK